MNRSLAPALCAALLLSVSAAAAPAVSADYAAALSGSQRSAESRARDRYRHPRATLSFFGLKPDMTVVEIWPAGGWYTEVLAPLLKARGTYYAAHLDPAASEGAAKSVARFKEKLTGSDAYAKVRLTSFGKGRYDSLAPAGSADMVLTFRNIHNWYAGGYAGEAFKAFYRALKPGGILGVVEHRLPEDRADALMKTSGYMKVSTVKALAEAAGFKFVAASDLNVNPKDGADYAKGVWTLPPTLTEGDKDRARYLGIGESDRMTLKFVKPAA